MLTRKQYFFRRNEYPRSLGLLIRFHLCRNMVVYPSVRSSLMRFPRNFFRTPSVFPGKSECLPAIKVIYCRDCNLCENYFNNASANVLFANQRRETRNIWERRTELGRFFPDTFRVSLCRLFCFGVDD